LKPEFDAAFDALEMGDLESFDDHARPLVQVDCEFHSGLGSVVGGGTYKGADGIKEWFGDFVESTAERRWLDRTYEFPHPDVLVFLSRLEIVGRASGVPLVSETGAVFVFKDALCVRIDSFTSFEEARDFAEGAHA
jgi:hypothetical protein